MKKLVLAAMLAAALSARLVSSPVYPGTTIYTATSVGGEALFATDAQGFGGKLGFSVEGLPLPRFQGTVNFGYRWLSPERGLIPMPNAGLSAGYRFPVKNLFSLTPLLGAELNAAFADGRFQPVPDFTAGLRVSLRLAGRDYLTATPSFSLPLDSSFAPRFSLSLGTRSEAAWPLPPAKAKPRITAVPALFSPDADGIDDTTSFILHAANQRSILSWKVTVYSGDGASFAEFTGRGKLPKTLRWDGRSSSGDEPQPAFDYRIVLETTDAFGSVERSETKVTVDILVLRDGDRYKIRVPDIRFPSYSFELSEKESKSLLEENRAILERIATLFNRFPDYSLTVEGHANAVNWKDPKKFKLEQEEVLVPLSVMRAETVRQALVMLGISANRINAVGLGGSRPVVPFSDSSSVWKNRRLYFFIKKKKKKKTRHRKMPAVCLF